MRDKYRGFLNSRMSPISTRTDRRDVGDAVVE